jgi:hypothetical protein
MNPQVAKRQLDHYLLFTRQPLAEQMPQMCRQGTWHADPDMGVSVAHLLFARAAEA